MNTGSTVQDFLILVIYKIVEHTRFIVRYFVGEIAPTSNFAIQLERKMEKGLAQPRWDVYTQFCSLIPIHYENACWQLVIKMPSKLFFSHFGVLASWPSDT